MTTTALRRELEFVSPTRQRVMGILFLLAGVVIWFVFGRHSTRVRSPNLA